MGEGRLLRPLPVQNADCALGAWPRLFSFSRELGSRAEQSPRAAGGSWDGVTFPASHSIKDIPCTRGGKEAGMCLGKVTLVLPNISGQWLCSSSAGSVSLQGSHFLGEDFRNEVAHGAKWGLLGWVGGTWRL